tara:strand:+ start:19720 stop:19971 length:252 start_codon:yes stop_codon:yes gene_type:complete
MEMINCSRCEVKMPELRLTKFGYDFCVNCSTEKPKKAINITGGSGDHTYNTIQVVTSEQYDSFKRQEKLNSKVKFGDAESKTS